MTKGREKVQGENRGRSGWINGERKQKEQAKEKWRGVERESRVIKYSKTVVRESRMRKQDKIGENVEKRKRKRRRKQLLKIGRESEM